VSPVTVHSNAPVERVLSCFGSACAEMNLSIYRSPRELRLENPSSLSQHAPTPQTLTTTHHSYTTPPAPLPLHIAFNEVRHNLYAQTSRPGDRPNHTYGATFGRRRPTLSDQMFALNASLHPHTHAPPPTATTVHRVHRRTLPPVRPNFAFGKPSHHTYGATFGGRRSDGVGHSTGHALDDFVG
jgi:hypothetical protein